MSIWWVVGFIVWILLLFPFWAICKVGSKADKIKQNKNRHVVDTHVIEKLASETREKGCMNDHSGHNRHNEIKSFVNR